MKIVNVLGGLGNQMFEYAMYLALKTAHPDEVVKVCTRSYAGYGLHNGLEIARLFGVPMPEASLLELSKVAYPFVNYRMWQVMRHYLPKRHSMTRGGLDIPFDYGEVTRTDSVYYEGYWQNEKNFQAIRSDILKTYAFPELQPGQTRDLVLRLADCNAVSCHVRRGDYLKEPDMCVCTEDYYRNALREMQTRTTPELYCIFSDDIAWCRTHLTPLLGSAEAVFVDWNKGTESYRDMQLMSLCRHNIIANSSFSWWGAWLNVYVDKLVIAPPKWVNSPIKNDPVCDGWIRVDN